MTLSWQDSNISRMTYKPTKLGQADLFFTALLGMQTRSSDENSVRPSVCQTREL